MCQRAQMKPRQSNRTDISLSRIRRTQSVTVHDVLGVISHRPTAITSISDRAKGSKSRLETYIE
jgi:hypothetical protein